MGQEMLKEKVMLDLFFLKVSNIANQVFTLAAFAHESFSNPSSSLPAYNNSAYQQQGKVRWDCHLKSGRATRWSDVVQVVDLGSGLQIYTVGEGADRPCVIWNYDIEGFDGGR